MNDIAEYKAIAQKQEHEIMLIRSELQKIQSEKVSRLEDSLFSPALFEHYQKVAGVLAKSGMVPKQYIGKAEDIFVAMAMGYQLGFPVEQSLQDIAVINGRPCLWGDGLLSLALNHPECEYINEEPIFKEGVVVGHRCIVKRKGHQEYVKDFTVQDADKAGLLRKEGVWKQYPGRMLQMRARSFALRDKFADALRGLRVAEIEEEDYTLIEGEYTKAESNVEKLKSIINVPEIEREPMISVEQKDKIEILIQEKEIQSDRLNKAFEYFKVSAIDELTNEKAEMFIMQLQRA